MSDFSVKEAVTNRYSVRTYDKKPIEQETKEKLLAYAKGLENPLGPKVNVQFIEKNTATKGEKLGTYGVIKGASSYLGATVPKEEYALEALGYDFEKLVLYATSLGLGTCWLGGTFNRGAFASAMKMEENELFPIVSPIGYPAQKKSVLEQIMRKTTKADARLPWKELFFKNDLHTALSEKEAGEYVFPLEMLRQAPSAVNKQPWRVIAEGDRFHFYEKRSATTEAVGVDMHRIDVGIGICHFHLAALEQGLQGQFERNEPQFHMPKDMSYIVSWVRE